MALQSTYASAVTNCIKSSVEEHDWRYFQGKVDGIKQCLEILGLEPTVTLTTKK